MKCPLCYDNFKDLEELVLHKIIDHELIKKDIPHESWYDYNPTPLSE